MTATLIFAPAIVWFAAGWFGREWYELRRIARMAAAYDPYAEQFEHQSPAPPVPGR
jgi:hypothetical protein